MGGLQATRQTGAIKNRWVLMQAAEELVVWDHELLFTSVASEINKEMEALQPLEQTDSSAGECSCHFAHVCCLCTHLQVCRALLRSSNMCRGTLLRVLRMSPLFRTSHLPCLPKATVLKNIALCFVSPAASWLLGS